MGLSFNLPTLGKYSHRSLKSLWRTVKNILENCFGQLAIQSSVLLKPKSLV
jgi:hypothetical protein